MPKSSVLFFQNLLNRIIEALVQQYPHSWHHRNFWLIYQSCTSLQCIVLPIHHRMQSPKHRRHWGQLKNFRFLGHSNLAQLLLHQIHHKPFHLLIENVCLYPTNPTRQLNRCFFQMFGRIQAPQYHGAQMEVLQYG